MQKRGQKRGILGVKTGVFAKTPVFGFLDPSPSVNGCKIEVVWSFFGRNLPPKSNYIGNSPSTAKDIPENEFARRGLKRGKG